jgi:hypothetical protein
VGIKTRTNQTIHIGFMDASGAHQLSRNASGLKNRLVFKLSISRLRLKIKSRKVIEVSAFSLCGNAVGYNIYIYSRGYLVVGNRWLVSIRASANSYTVIIIIIIHFIFRHNGP